MNQLMAENASDTLMIQPKQIVATASSSDTTKLTTVSTEVLAEKSTGTYKEAVGLYVNGNFIGAVENAVDLDNMLQDLLNNNFICRRYSNQNRYLSCFQYRIC